MMQDLPHSPTERVIHYRPRAWKITEWLIGSSALVLIMSGAIILLLDLLK